MEEKTEKKTYLLEIPAEKQGKRGWSVELNGQKIDEVSQLVLANPKFGQLTYGLHPAGYDVWGFREIGGGGSVIVPFVKIENEIYIGLIQQRRDTQGGLVWNVPRGFLTPGETHFVAATREVAEELGGIPKYDPFLLDGAPVNSNSAFFETWRKDEGTRCFGLQFFPQDFDSDRRLRDSAITPNPELETAKLAEQIMGSKFVHWSEAAQVEDGFSAIGVARLLAHLRSR